MHLPCLDPDTSLSSNALGSLAAWEFTKACLWALTVSLTVTPTWLKFKMEKVTCPQQSCRAIFGFFSIKISRLTKRAKYFVFTTDTNVCRIVIDNCRLCCTAAPYARFLRVLRTERVAVAETGAPRKHIPARVESCIFSVLIFFAPTVILLPIPPPERYSFIDLVSPHSS